MKLFSSRPRTKRMVAAMLFFLAGPIAETHSKARKVNAVSVYVKGMDYSLCGTAVLKIPTASKDFFVNVRAGPGDSYERVGRIYRDEGVIVCNERGNWVGVVYGIRADCNPRGMNVNSPKLPASCRSGWVRRKWIEVTSG